VRISILSLVVVVASICLGPPSAAAYVGPGAGISVIGSLLALLAAIAAAILGFLWFPLRRLMRKRKLTVADEKEKRESQT
jgi:hypothetical protein